MLALVALVAVALAAAIPFDSSSGWVARTTWSAFATLSALVLLVSRLTPTNPRSWLIGAVATGCLLATWVLVTLPGVASNAGFVGTVGAAAAAAACWLAPGRPAWAAP